MFCDGESQHHPHELLWELPEIDPFPKPINAIAGLLSSVNLVSSRVTRAKFPGQKVSDVAETKGCHNDSARKLPKP